MDFSEKIQELANQAVKHKQQALIKTEEGTKNALIMPFISALGYNVFDPSEVTPELVADVGTKKGEKVDYAILRDGKPIMLFECKAFDTDLNEVHTSQLYRYFSVTEARFGVLTNGVVYQFYTDLEAPNKMDSKPFLVFDMLDIKDTLVEELKKFTKSAFDIDKIISTASELKYTNAIKRIIVNQLAQPSEDFVRYFANQVYNGRLTHQVLEQFTEITKRAWRDVITDRMKEAFTKAAENAEGSDDKPETTPPIEIAPDNKISTTQDELDAYNIVRAVVREIIDVKRVTMRDAQSYCSVLLDDNNRKLICRLYFNFNKKYVGIPDEQKQETKLPIESVDDIYKYADKLKIAVKIHLPAESTTTS